MVLFSNCMFYNHEALDVSSRSRRTATAWVTLCPTRVCFPVTEQYAARDRMQQICRQVAKAASNYGLLVVRRLEVDMNELS